MSSGNAITTLSTINRRAMPAVVISVLLTTGAAIILGWFSLLDKLGENKIGIVFADYLWIVIWVSSVGLVALIVNILVFFLLARKLALPLGRLAGQADRLTARGQSAQITTESNIHEIRQLTESFNRLFTLQQNQAEELRTIHQNILHDIRTPISHISAQAEEIYNRSAKPEKAAEIISEACHSIINLCETNAEISGNNSFFEPEPASELDLASVFDFCCDLYSVVADVNGVKFTHSRDVSSTVFRGHKRKLQHLINNLIDNAIKFTPAGGSVVASLFLKGDAISIIVSDTGSGIPNEIIPYLYERGFRANYNSEKSGSGLGLALVKSIVTFYHGTITCESAPGNGSTFRVALPLRPQTKPPTRPLV